jgi:glyoxylase-like metal-dependent hydrolase (beta-lactamase superfamily II)
MNMALKQLGKFVSYSPFGINDRPNIGLIKGGKCSLAVDSGNSENQARLFLTTAEETGQKPDYLVLTHSHWDHVFGAYYFNAKTVCQTNTEIEMKKMAALDYSDEALNLRVKLGTESVFSRNNIKNEHPTRSSFPFPQVDLTFTDSIAIHLGSVDCIIKYIESIHHAGSCTVYVPQDNILFLGDCLWMNMSVPNWYYSIPKLYTLSKELKAYDADYYIDSHCEPIPKEALFAWLDGMCYASELAIRLKGDKAAILREVELKRIFENLEFIPLEMVIDALAQGASMEQ